MIKLSDRVSQDDIERVNDMRNHPDYMDGFGGSDENGGGGGDDMEFDFDDFFDDNSSGGGSTGGDGGDPFGSSSGSSNPFGDSNRFGNDSGSNPFGGGGNSNPFGGGGSTGGFGQPNNNPFGNSGGFGQSNNNPFGGGGGFGQPSGGFGQPSGGFGSGGFGQGGFGQVQGPFGDNPFNQQQQQQQQPQADTFDKALGVATETFSSLGKIMYELAVSTKYRNADDWGYLSRNCIVASGIVTPIGLVLGIIGSILGVKVLSFAGLGSQLSLCGGLFAATGLIGMGVCALILSKMDEDNVGSIHDIPDEEPSNDNVINEYEDNIGSELDDLLGDDFDDLFGDSTSDIEAEPEEPTETFTPNLDDIDNEPINFDEKLDEVGSNMYLSRENLFNTFKGMLPTNTPKFSTRSEIDVDSQDFGYLETICMKAIANLANCQLEEVNSHLEKAEETYFSYELRMQRINKVKKTDDLAREIEVYMREDSSDTSVNATVSIEGDFYKIIVTKGVKAIVTLGDIFRIEEYCEYFKNTKHALPVILGIDELGNVLVDDAKTFDTMLIAGKPRSGKSWYVLSILMCLMLFNCPDDVIFVIIDPKESNLFKTVSLLPHVCGLHNDEHVLDILDDIIEVEAPRRKQLLSDHRCDDIWALRKKGIKLPVLYLVIDEYITVRNNLDSDRQKELDMKIQTLITQLPSLGIRLMFIPHRSTGIVNKTNRSMIQFTAAIRSTAEDIKDTLDIPKWTRALTEPGDIALKSSNMPTAKFARGAALTEDDGSNTIFIETAAKAFYKMGVDMPDTSNMKIACNRNAELVKKELGIGNNRVQFDISKLDKNYEDIKLADA